MAISSETKTKELINKLIEMRSRNNFIGDVSNLHMAVEEINWSDVPSNSKRLCIRNVFKSEVNRDDYLPSEAEEIMHWLTGEPWVKRDEPELLFSPIQGVNESH